MSRQIRTSTLNGKPQSRDETESYLCQVSRALFREKPLSNREKETVPKPTQVGEASSLRGTGDSSLRNSAKKRA